MNDQKGRIRRSTYSLMNKRHLAKEKQLEAIIEAQNAIIERLRKLLAIRNAN